MSKKVFITGAFGQDGQLLIKHLLENTDYEIYGFTTSKELSASNRLKLMPFHAAKSLTGSIKPDYFINFAGFTDPKGSFLNPEECYSLNLNFVISILEEIGSECPKCVFLNAGSCHEFLPQKQSPYSLSKFAARDIINFYRDSLKLNVLQVTLSNHISHLRGEKFVDGKIFAGAKRIKGAIESRQPFEPISLGNVGVVKDWMHAEDTVRAIWAIAESGEYSKDYHIRSGVSRAIRLLVEKTFASLNIEGVWIDEYGEKLFILQNYLSDFCDVRSQVLVRAERDEHDCSGVYVNIHEGDASEFGWQQKYSFLEMIGEILSH